MRKEYKYFAIAVFCLLTAFLGSIVWYNVQKIKLQQVGSNKTISLSGEGKVIAKPDVAEISFGVITQNADSSKAQSENDSKMKVLTDLLKSQGIDEKDITTTTYNLEPQYNYNYCRTGATDYRTCPPKITGYQLTQRVTVKIRDFSKINLIVGSLTPNGANDISQINFTVDGLSGYQLQAQIAAIQEVMKKKVALEKATGIKIGQIISINSGSNVPLYNYKAVDMQANASFGSGVNEAAINPGSQEITSQQTIVFSLE
ncbi:MAG TPA: SIMPL domain-containing protein [Candidatus Paceibacterota bacterium]|nr:SIMPL domain-containing protein [Candidatus Paceibacterota bacterium]